MNKHLYTGPCCLFIHLFIIIIIFILQICLVHAMLSDTSCIVGEFHIYFYGVCVWLQVVNSQMCLNVPLHLHSVR